MLKFKRKTYFFFIIFLSLIAFSIYSFFYENNPLNNYYNNFSNSFFKLEKLKLDGRARSNKTKILSSLSLELNSPILKVNLEKIKKNILSVPWTKSAKVSRKLPNEIHILIEEYEPAAIWENKNEVLILDKDGYHIEKIQKKDAYDDLLFVYGNEADLNLSNFLNALDDYPSLRSRIDYATFIGKRRWDLYFKEGVLIKLPMGDVNDALLELDQHLKDYNLIEKGHKKIDLRIKGEISTDRIFKRS